ncbi:hypothetical protein VFPPC_09885 [Pochonia chlamydosporia 170]|uniref:C2H2-type domain-containing protein n=1 Tax=Pochonia chlamydosporia 170 TaxID=1380566 RepID=A0A179FCW6_METCM|nr:hypothetical protein VFPPC_09885 [Pochonia chlamydosporia 170]OAQ63415.1 hypothetical protein VFPPC_09885 [Pochonia chlamydosporia 170]
MPEEITGSRRTEEPQPQTCVDIVEKGFGPYDWIYCLYPGCQSRGFQQGIDLEEHYKAAHTPSANTPSDQESATPVAVDPFDRLEVFLETLQGSADIEKPVDAESGKSTESLQKPIKRTKRTGWRWRCATCAQLIDLNTYGYVCPFCKKSRGFT